MDKNYLKRYMVQVEGLELKGSGVLFNYFDEVYIFTAKHNLEYKENQKVKNIDISELQKQKNNIKIYPHENLKVEDVIELEKSLDLLILKIDKSSIDGIKIDNLSIFGEELNNSLDYTVVGYPKIRNDKSIEFFDCKYEVSDNATFEVYSDKVSALSEKEKEEELVGLSGGGAFVESNGQIYLLGIQIRYEGFSNLECINLEKLKDKIDEKLIKSNIETIEEEIKLDSGESFKIKMVKVDLPDKSLYVSIYPVTYYQYDLFCIEKRDRKKINSYSNFDRTKFPVVKITYDDTIEFVSWLSKNSKNNLKYTLPSSEEWEFIAYENMTKFNICYEGSRPTRIGTNFGKKGIYDFLGNIQEICIDKVIRGGFFKNNLNKIIKNREGITLLPRKEVGFRVIQANL